MKNTMNAKVFCRKNTLGTLDFFLKVRTQEMYLFTTRYYSNVIYQMYCTGRRIEEAYDKTGMIRQQKLRERILRMAKYASSENELTLFEKATSKGKKTDIYYDER